MFSGSQGRRSPPQFDCSLVLGSATISIVQNTNDIVAFLLSDPRIVSLLRSVERLEIEDCWVGAGTIRNSIWDHLHGFCVEPTPGSDVDVVYHDPNDISPDRDVAIESRLLNDLPSEPWSVCNQARMHSRNGDKPYRDTKDAIRHWPETATAIAARMNGDSVEVIAPYGIKDLLDMVVRASPAFAQKPTVYRERIASKSWARRWPRLRFVEV